ncbi:hypothetical protein [Vibrio renipiscarius]|uniref:Uncharacterized protein n=1 Tax=Vibrio renipiscarius TaxID=1461322 RepID=A0A0C2JDD1_9VIBR|nr:hypothetical protein [Vibrio renipiscarius]KII75949.1 hypothetical protein OJ16_14015 [Vibrio renipiscarius]KII79053.1 hypothetical protein PL18_09475 [Vibrio renipiscarius]
MKFESAVNTAASSSGTVIQVKKTQQQRLGWQKSNQRSWQWIDLNHDGAQSLCVLLLHPDVFTSFMQIAAYQKINKVSLSFQHKDGCND